MKRTLITLAAALGLAIVPSTSVFAQQLVALYNVPFAFNAAGVQLPSGRYIVSNTGLDASTLAGPHGSIMFSHRAGLSSKPAAGHLMFKKYGDAYFLREVWQDNGTGSKIRTSSQEKEIIRAQQLAKNSSSAVLVATSR